tara:strand:+ start:1740 stop:2336 length:597 start_codon:yes stop_codon:yes gene_type:complete
MLNSKYIFINHLTESIKVKEMILNDKLFTSNFLKVSNELIKTIKKNNTIFTCGNGGSASDSHHMTAELMVRLRKSFKRQPIPCIPLSADISSITAHCNDFDFSTLYSRALDALGKKNDCLIVFSTSGNSSNILKVLKKAKEKRITSIAFLGNNGGKAKNLSDHSVITNSNIISHIQETHITLIHILVQILEENLFNMK